MGRQSSPGAVPQGGSALLFLIIRETDREAVCYSVIIHPLKHLGAGPCLLGTAISLWRPPLELKAGWGHY